MSSGKWELKNGKQTLPGIKGKVWIVAILTVNGHWWDIAKKPVDKMEQPPPPKNSSNPKEGKKGITD